MKPADGGKDVFVHYTQVQVEGFKTLEAEQVVEYEIGTNDKGEMAANVKVVE